MPAEIQLTSTRRSARNSGFELTSQRLLLEVRNGDTAALDELCSRYWYPLYTWLLATRLARSEADAQDFVQGFFEKMLARGTLAAHQPERGRFRSYLLACLKHHVIDMMRRPVIQLSEPTDNETDPLANIEANEPADAAFEKAWAWDLFEAAKAKLRHDWQMSGLVQLFDVFAPYLEGNRSEEGLESIGGRFGLSHDNTRTRLFRLKKELHKLLAAMVAAELPDDATTAEHSDEMRHFLEALLL